MSAPTTIAHAPGIRLVRPIVVTIWFLASVKMTRIVSKRGSR